MLKYFIIFSAFFISTSALAQCQMQKLTDLSKISSYINAPEVLSGKFEQEKNISDMGIKLKSSGKFSINKSKGILWNTETPVANTIIVEDDKICINNGAKYAIMDSDANQTMKQIIEVMKSLLVQDYQKLKQHFDISAEICDGYNIHLKSKDKTISSLFTRLDVNGHDYVSDIIFYNQEGDITKITFKDVSEKSEEFSCE